MRERPAQRYVPLLSIAIVLFLAFAVLPSALNLPQTNPATTLEYAPVPPSDDDRPPPGGDLSSLSLATSGELGTGDGLGEGPGAGGGALGGLGKNPKQKRCVGDPPRQTEDPMAPPCVAFFDGDNFGATMQGVARDEIRVIIYNSAYFWPTGRPEDNEVNHAGKYFDLGKPPAEPEPLTARHFRRYQRAFNERYMTYNRHVRFIVQQNSAQVTDEARRADAADAYAKYKPFAVLTSRLSGNSTPYVEAMARKGVLNFGIPGSNPQDFYTRFPALIWTFWPSTERSAAAFAAFVCKQVLGHPVVDSGNPADNGKPRKLGLLYTTDPARPDARLLAAESRRLIEACGGQFVAEATFPIAFRYTNTFTADPGANAQQNIANFMQKGVTTIIWPGGIESDHSKAAKRANWFPEWILAGDQYNEPDGAGFYQDQDVWNHATVVSHFPLYRRNLDGSACHQALAEADPARWEEDGPIYYDITCNAFADIRQLFTGIQVAGPRLTVRTIDQGFHAIPPKQSDDPRKVACFYDPGDYTCLKDYSLIQWVKGARTPSTGCYRMVAGGLRRFPNAWPDANIHHGVSPSDPCNDHQGPAVL